MSKKGWGARFKAACNWKDESFPFPQKRWLGWVVFYGFWTLLAVLFAGQLYSVYQQSGQNISWWKALLESISNWYIWGLFSIFIVRLSRRFPLDRPQWLRNLIFHIGAGFFFSALQIAIYVLFDWFGDWVDFTATGQIYLDANAQFNFLGRFELHMTSLYSVGVLVYWAIIAYAHLISYYRKYEEQRLRASQLEAKLAQAKLQALRTQINPHFLFNTLNTISALIHKDPESADRMLVKLSDLLRLTLDAGEKQEVDLQEELDFLKRYLEMEKIRFGSRLEIIIDVEPQILNAQLPHLILQPLVENSLRHGIAPHAKNGRIEIHGHRANGMIELQIQDNGTGLSVYEQANLQEGIGISNTRERLKQLYGADQQFDLRSAPEGGLIATLRIPYRTAPQKGREQ